MLCEKRKILNSNAKNQAASIRNQQHKVETPVVADQYSLQIIHRFTCCTDFPKPREVGAKPRKILGIIFLENFHNSQQSLQGHHIVSVRYLIFAAC
jgi:hypothetical protein